MPHFLLQNSNIMTHLKSTSPIALMKKLALLSFIITVAACAGNQEDKQSKETTPKEVNEISNAVGTIFITPDKELSKEQSQIKSLLQLVMIDYLKIDTINKSAHWDLTKEDCSKLGLSDAFYEYLNEELNSTIHSVDSMGLWKEWSSAFLEIQSKATKNNHE